MNKGQEEMMNIIYELKNTVEGIKRRPNEAEDWISELENKIEKNSQKEQEKENRLKKSEDRLREMQDNMKCNNIYILGIPHGEEEQRIENLCEKVIMETYTNLMREKITQVQEEEMVPIMKNPERSTPRLFIIKMTGVSQTKEG